MTQPENDFRLLLIEAEVEEIMEKIQGILFSDYNEKEEENITPEEIWEENNSVEVNDMPHFFRNLQEQGMIPYGMKLHYTVYNSEDSYESMNSRFIVFDGLMPVYVDHFDNIIVENETERQYKGLSKKGCQKLLTAVLMYGKYKEITLREI